MNDQSRTDGALVAAVVGGDLNAFGALVNRYRDTYTRFAVRMLGDRGDAEDVLQNVWMRVYRNIESCRDADRFGGWVYQIVLNECRTHLTRRTQRDRKFADGSELDRLVAPAASDVLLLDEIQKAIDTLPDEQREAFLLKHVEQMEYDEMAELTGAGVSALKMRVKRAVERLRGLLEGVQYG